MLLKSPTKLIQWLLFVPIELYLFVTHFVKLVTRYLVKSYIARNAKRMRNRYLEQSIDEIQAHKIKLLRHADKLKDFDFMAYRQLHDNATEIDLQVAEWHKIIDGDEE